MRNAFRDAITEVMAASSTTYFVTGDLGFNALETLQQRGGSRFINGGVAEQSMIGIAAGIASLGNETFVYSIAPFATFRCLEQIRLDVCIHDLPVYIVGNGGGYGYGIMGATHHAIEDLGCMSTLDNMTCWVPAFTDDVEECIRHIRLERKPAYLRLGLGTTRPAHSEGFKPVSRIRGSAQPRVTIVCLGPIIANALEAIDMLEDPTVADVFSVVQLPFASRSLHDVIQSVTVTHRLVIVEEHVSRGGLSEYLLSILADQGIHDMDVQRLHAQGYPNGLYGSQRYHQTVSGLDASSIRSLLEALR